MRCLSFFINKKIWGKIMCRHVPKVPYGSYAPDYQITGPCHYPRKYSYQCINTVYVH